MSNGDLEARVATLETTLAALIDNLAENNQTLFNLLAVFVQSTNGEAEKQSALTQAISDVCGNNPPGC